MKAAPILAEMNRHSELEPLLVHTGQHFDYLMSKVFFEQLNLPEPNRNLEVAGGSHHEQSGEVIKRFGEYVQTTRPDCVVVAGDVNATAACALVTKKEKLPLVHVEAGLRSGDRRMPEEINRIVTDSISDLLLVTEKSGLENLRREGVPDDKVVFTGNVMIDSLTQVIPEAQASDVIDRMGLRGRYILLTLHRPSNVDNADSFKKTMAAVAELAQTVPVIFPVHPRTQKMMRDVEFPSQATESGAKVGESGIFLIPPSPYKEFVALQASATLVITDSGGIQEETTYLGVPCLTYRESTERPITVEIGTNRLLGTKPENLLAEAKKVLEGKTKLHSEIPPLWDGQAAVRIVAAILQFLQKQKSEKATEI
jgi:UDP-N-acetylglucosamine 2-epimerase (non-hydrolysing)